MGLFKMFKKKEKNEIIEEQYIDQGEFKFMVHDVFLITGRGTVVTGIVETGSIKVGDLVYIYKEDELIKATTVIGIEKFRKIHDFAQEGENVGILLRGITSDKVSSGYIITDYKL